MPSLGNVWHIPNFADPRGLSSMRSPSGAVGENSALTFWSGNQFAGPGNAANQLQAGSELVFRRGDGAGWARQPMQFRRELGNNKYYTATIAAGTFQPDDAVEYYLRIPYSDRDITFVMRNGDVSATTASEAAAQTAPFRFTIARRAQVGEWGPLFGLPNVGIHAHLLPDGRVLMWGRRDNPGDSLDVHQCTPFIWDPTTGGTSVTSQPRDATGASVNLFCSGHSFLPDGRLLVVGGHLFDGDGIDQACLFDWRSGQFTAVPLMTSPLGEAVRRWYPTATTLPNGHVLVMSGSYRGAVVDLLQVYDGQGWTTIDNGQGGALNFVGLPLYPRMHLLSNGQLFMSGTNDRTLMLRTGTPGAWVEVAIRRNGNRDYCPAVMYDTDRIVYIGGGNDANTHTPTANVETIDLRAQTAQWQNAAPLHIPRRQHNATLLPDGTVLVTGGTRGGAGPNNGFNDLAQNQPVHGAEVWDPGTNTWRDLAAEDEDRCYHATALLLPDGSVLSAGGGEYRPDNVNDNAPEDSHRTAQRFFPPYFFQGARPRIEDVPSSFRLGTQFRIQTDQAPEIRKITLLSPGSLTHSFDQHQHVCFLQFMLSADGSGLDVTLPTSSSVCPPRFYLLFIVNQQGVPSVARMVQVLSQVAIAAIAPALAEAAPNVAATAAPRGPMYLQIHKRAEQIRETARGTRVVVGLTGTCPYGIGACWGGAYEALQRLSHVAVVDPLPNVEESTATVYLEDDCLPPLAEWREQFQRVANGSYEMRGFEVTLRGELELREGSLFVRGSQGRPEVRLDAARSEQSLGWNHDTRARKPLSNAEINAYENLLEQVVKGAVPAARVSGLLEITASGDALHVRDFSLA